MIGLPSGTDLLNAIAPRHGGDVTRGVAYGPEPRHLLDIYRPARHPGPLPVIVFFHGGAWQYGSRTEYRFVGPALARLGLVVAIPDYRLYPAVHYPDFLRDAARATAWIAREIDGYGGDSRAIFVAGHSAGAYLALMLALAPTWLAEAGHDRASLAGAIGLAGPYDFLPLTDPVHKAIFAPEPDLASTQPIAHADGAAPP
ncbi:MAG TPA: alpha/beta hydrolase, partial [Acidiphilium sp.]